MTILLTNDDGFASEGIIKLADSLRAEGKHRVLVFAPDSNRSGISHALSLLYAPVQITKTGEDSWKCSGNPADCVIVAMRGGIPVVPDLVLSGINQGENLGTDLVYSGTAAAARQASIMGVPSIALSLAGNGVFYWDMAAAWVTQHLEQLRSYWKKDSFVNVNIPNRKAGPEGLRIAPPGIKAYQNTLTFIDSADGSRWCAMDFMNGVSKAQAGSDCDVVSRNFASVSSVYNYPVESFDSSTSAHSSGVEQGSR